MFPRATAGARVERRVKSARPATARSPVSSASLGSHADAHGAGRRRGTDGTFDQERIVVECIPTGAPIIETIASSGRVLDGFRDTFVQEGARPLAGEHRRLGRARATRLRGLGPRAIRSSRRSASPRSRVARRWARQSPPELAKVAAPPDVAAAPRASSTPSATSTRASQSASAPSVVCCRSAAQSDFRRALAASPGMSPRA